MRIMSKEVGEIAEKVFQYIRRIPNLPKISIGELKETQDNMAFLPEKIDIVSKNVIGGYTAEFNFTIYYQVSKEAHNESFEAMRVLNYISKQLYQMSVEEKMPYLSDLDIAQRFEMTSNPKLMQNDKDENIVYGAKFIMRYMHKSNIF